jgi:hypothetical protein
MNLPAKRLDVVAMTSATHRAANVADDFIQRATRLQDDPEREKRISACLCRVCYYVSGRIGGAAMTTQPCAGCGEDQHYSSTATDNLCVSCAREHNLCKRCGGDREMRTLRRKWPSFIPKEIP